MRKILKRLLAAVSICSLLCAAQPVFAGDITTSGGTANATVTYSVSSSWSVTVPATIAIGGTKKATFDIASTGNISGAAAVTVTISSGTLSLTSSASDSISAKISATDGGAAITTLATFDNANSASNTSNTPATGKTYDQETTLYIEITDTTIPAGSYTGTLTFTATES